MKKSRVWLLEQIKLYSPFILFLILILLILANPTIDQPPGKIMGKEKTL